MARRSRRSSRSVKVKAHTRSPRGPNKGKPRPRVKAHGRGMPRGGRRRKRR